MEGDKFTAADARKLANKSHTSVVTKLLKLIQSSAKDGGLSTTIASDLAEGDRHAIVAALKAKGFQATYVIDQRDGDYYQISW
jgi:hypothetical protein